jgi:hypothetical protein
LIRSLVGQRHGRRQHDFREQRLRRRRRPRQRRRLVRVAARARPEQHPGAAQWPPHRQPTAPAPSTVDLNAFPLGAIAPRRNPQGRRLGHLRHRRHRRRHQLHPAHRLSRIGGSRYTGNFTEDGGGAKRRLSLLGGVGSLQVDGFNLMGSVTYDNDEKLSSRERSFANGFQPARGLSPDTTGTPFANQLSGRRHRAGRRLQDARRQHHLSASEPAELPGQVRRRLRACRNTRPRCGKTSPPPTRSTYSCAYDYGADYVISFPVERLNAVSRGTVKINAGSQACSSRRLYGRTKATVGTDAGADLGHRRWPTAAPIRSAARTTRTCRPYISDLRQDQADHRTSGAPTTGATASQRTSPTTRACCSAPRVPCWASGTTASACRTARAPPRPRLTGRLWLHRQDVRGAGERRDQPVGGRHGQSQTPEAMALVDSTKLSRRRSSTARPS